jgi:hypothetical protein
VAFVSRDVKWAGQARKRIEMPRGSCRDTKDPYDRDPHFSRVLRVALYLQLRYIKEPMWACHRAGCNTIFVYGNMFVV